MSGHEQPAAQGQDFTTLAEIVTRKQERGESSVLCSVTEVAEMYEALLDAERRALAYQEFIAYTDDNYGDRMGSRWKAHARAVLLDE